MNRLSRNLLSSTKRSTLLRYERNYTLQVLNANLIKFKERQQINNNLKSYVTDPKDWPKTSQVLTVKAILCYFRVVREELMKIVTILNRQHSWRLSWQHSQSAKTCLNRNCRSPPRIKSNHLQRRTRRQFESQILSHGSPPR